MPLTLYYRSGCSLCEQMLQELTPLQQRYGFELQMIDIDSRADLQARFNERVPLLFAGETLLAEYFLDPQQVHAHFS